MHFLCVFALLYIVKKSKQGKQAMTDTKLLESMGWGKYDCYARSALLLLGRRNPSLLCNRLIPKLLNSKN